LQVHPLWPASWGGDDAIVNLASVCASHHAQLAPQGDVLLLGNPSHPATLAADQARAGPEAA
jgi:ABC-type cobalamin transport system ATPase subunit